MATKVYWLLGGILVGGLLTAGALALAGQTGQQRLAPDVLFSQTLSEVAKAYVDPVDKTALTDIALKALVASLDSHSKYLEADDIRDLEEMADGHYSGLGLEVAFDKDQHLVVTSPLKGSPAAKAGIKRGDWVLAINNQSTKGKSLTALAHDLRGKPKQEVQLLIERDNKPLHFAIMPAEVKVDSVTSYMLDENRLWLRISQFQYSTPSEVTQAIEAHHPQSVILDLRGDPGGVLASGVDVADLFLTKGPIVSTRGRAAYANQVFSAKSGDPFESLPLLVLMDKDSASAAEIVAGALKDRGRALILGQQSYGKGSVQSLIPIAGGDRAIKLTTARYLTPSGVSIQGKGIKPNIAAGTVLSGPKVRSLLKSQYPLARKAEVAAEGKWADDAELWEAIAYLDHKTQQQH
ncbi:S41 family peptidase [Gallaecimonas mangrovi]|uniref:S41 family peptidase n=1 Tax=Gallaecimonas mangrovi TaxID=2291597 RepID=UPI000E206257|nr:S41 family peptidase [Gallaecimonas mangrovi]